MPTVNGTIDADADEGSYGYSGGWNAYSGPYFGWWNAYREWTYHRFTLDAALPSGATITAATWNVRPAVDAGGPWYAYVQESGDAAQFSSVADRPAIDGGNTATYPTTAEGSGALLVASDDLTANTWSYLDVSGLIQSIVTIQGGFASGEHITLLLAGTSAAGADSALRDIASGYAATLTIEYTEGGTPANTNITPGSAIRGS